MKKIVARLVRQSPAMVVAMLALFVALTGTAVATTSALITGAQIKNGSITGADIKNKSLKPVDFSGAIRGARGAAGPPGAQGPQGPAGAPNPNAVDSDKVDGKHANELVRVARGEGNVTLNSGGFDSITAASVTINAPAPGFVLVTGSSTTYNFAAPAGCPCIVGSRIHRRGGGGSSRWYIYNDLPAGARPAATTSTDTIPVPAGANTFDLKMTRLDGTASLSTVAEITALYVPFGSTGTGTLATDRRVEARDAAQGGR